MNIWNGFVVLQIHKVVVYIGINDKQEIVGVADSKRLMEDIPNKTDYLITCIVADVNLLHSNEDKEFIEIVVNQAMFPLPITVSIIIVVVLQNRRWKVRHYNSSS